MMNRTLLVACALLMGASFFATERAALAQEAYIGEIRLFAGTYCPQGWARADGQILDISQNQPLYSLLGVTYGGNGRTTFALPDLRGRAPIHQGHGSGLSPYRLGAMGGVEEVTLTINQLPAHNHTHSSLSLTSPDEGMHLVTTEQSGENTISVAMSNQHITGSSLSHRNMPPYLVMNYCIALVGTYPPRQ